MSLRRLRKLAGMLVESTLTESKEGSFTATIDDPRLGDNSEVDVEVEYYYYPGTGATQMDPEADDEAEINAVLDAGTGEDLYDKISPDTMAELVAMAIDDGQGDSVDQQDMEGDVEHERSRDDMYDDVDYMRKMAGLEEAEDNYKTCKGCGGPFDPNESGDPDYCCDDCGAYDTEGVEENLDEEWNDAVSELAEIMEQLEELGNRAANIVRENYPELYQQYHAYGAFNFGSSSNRHDTTFEQLVQHLDSDGEDEY